MAEEELGTDATEEQSEATEQPSPSTPSLVSPAEASAPTFDTDALVEKLSGVLDEKISRTFQSAKDRRFADVELISKYLQEAGGDVSKATRDMKLDEIYERLGSDGAAGPAAQGDESNQAYMEARTAQLLSGVGIDFEDPDYKMLVAQYGGRITNPDQWIGVVEAFTGQRQNKQAKQELVSPAAAASESGKVITAEGDEDIESLTQELTKLMAQPATAETMKARAELRQRLSAQQDKIGLLQNVRFDGS